MSFKEFYRNINPDVRIGVVGYSEQKFDTKKAAEYIKKSFDKIVSTNNQDAEFTVVSGWTDLGIPSIAYKEAKSRKWHTAGIACKKALELKTFLCDQVTTVGEEWGDESETFLNDITVLVRIGGGKQSKAETAKAKEMGIKVIELDLEEK